jgi:hypothetical protein
MSDHFEGFERSERFEVAPTQSDDLRTTPQVDAGRGSLQTLESLETVGGGGVGCGGQAQSDRVDRVEIDLTDGWDPFVLAPQLWQLLANSNDPPCLFRTDAGPVRLEIVDDEPRINELTRDRLAQEVHRVAKFVMCAPRIRKPQACPPQVVREMRATPFNAIPLPRLRQVARAPLIADQSGKILTENGYDRDLGIFLWCSESIPTVPSNPTAGDIERALGILMEPLADFPFVDEASRATAFAIQITPFVRPIIKGPTPLHLIEKATPGTGATLLTEALLTPAVGNTVERLTPPTSDHEWAYSLGAVLRRLPIAVVIDNARDLVAPQLAKALTDDVMLARVVGSSDTASIPVLCVWVGTGNNPTLHQEIARRALRCRLDAGSEQPWLGRTFKIPNLKEWLPQHRGEMIWAILTLIRSWFAAGQPKGKKILGMFESYSQILGGILEHLGVLYFLGDTALVSSDGDDLTNGGGTMVGDKLVGQLRRHDCDGQGPSDPNRRNGIAGS